MSDYVITDQTGRIDKVLTTLEPEITRSQLKNLINDGHVTVNGQPVKPKYKVQAGDKISLVKPEPQSLELTPENIPLDIVYEDDDVIVVNKPQGMVVHPAPGHPDHTLVNALLYHCKDLSGIGGVKRPGIVHRIDKETSGILVAAKNDVAHKGLCEQFAEHSIDRTYYAFCFGAPSPLNGTIEGNIGRSPYDRKKMAVLKTGGKPAITHYMTVENFKNLAAMVKCNLETGRTHQIRVHLSQKGNNLIGDKLYVKAKKLTAKTIDETKRLFVNNFARQALHAQSLGFVHPVTGEKMFFESEIPEDLKQLHEVLKNL